MDVSIYGGTVSITTPVFRKPSNSGIYLYAISKCSFMYKYITIKALFHCTYQIFAEGNSEQSISVLKQTLIDNSYPKTPSNISLNKQKCKRNMDHNRGNSQTQSPSDVPRTRFQKKNRSVDVEGEMSQKRAQSNRSHQGEAGCLRDVMKTQTVFTTKTNTSRPIKLS